MARGSAAVSVVMPLDVLVAVAAVVEETGQPRSEVISACVRESLMDGCSAVAA